MKGKPSPSQPSRKPGPASRAEIDDAIKALTEEDTERIEQSALNRIIRVGRAANGKSHEDLVQEALIRILEGTRNWYKDKDGVNFCQFLIGVIWSIASEWAGHRKRNKEQPEYAANESDLLGTDDQGKVTSPFDRLADPTLNVEEQLVDDETDTEIEEEQKNLADKIEAGFQHDEHASIVLMGFQDGMDGPAIRAEFGFSEKEFRTTTRRIQRRAK